MELLKTSAERDRLWMGSRDILIIMSFDGVFRDVSPAWTAVLGHGTREIVGRKASEFVLPDDVDAERAALTTAMTRSESDALENRYRHLDGTYRWISWHSSAEGDFCTESVGISPRPRPPAQRSPLPVTH